MAAIETKAKRYPTDLIYEEGDRMALLLPRSGKRGFVCGSRA